MTDPHQQGDTGEITRRHDTTPDAAETIEPAEAGAHPSPRPVTPSGPNALTASGEAHPPDAGAAGGAGGDWDRFSPAPQARLGWPDRDEAPAAAPERWYEPATPLGGGTVAPSQTRSRSGVGAGTILAVGLLSAVLASGGTVLALGAAGALDGPAASPAAVTGTPVTATDRPVTIDESSAIIDVAAKVSPAVVRITTTGSADSDFGVIPETGVGSGVIYDANGWILTNRHVVEGSQEMEVELSDGRVLTGRVYGIDTLTDLAIVKVDATGLPIAPLGVSDSLKVGQLVIAIGSPLGTYSNSVTSGIVSAKGRSITTNGNQQLDNLIQTDAAINPGNSGGPLLDAAGNIVGINTAIAADSNGIGFAIPIDIARPIMAQAVAGEELARPYMGIRYVMIDRQLAEEENLPLSEGALVGGGTGPGVAVEPGTPADEAGIQDGDIITRVEDVTIDGDHPLNAALSQFAPDQTVSIVVYRDGETLTLSVTLGTRPADL
jgi:S1-C subfamily serine protease